MDKLTKKKAYALSAEDLYKATSGYCNIFVYDELPKLIENNQSIEWLFKNHNRKDKEDYKYLPCVLLYPITRDMGHWTCLIRRNNQLIEHFDSYGFSTDQQLDLRYDKMPPYLSNMIANSSYDDIEFSNVQLQKLKKGVNTCGRWILMRIICWNHYGVTLEHFNEMFSQFNSQPLTPYISQLLIENNIDLKSDSDDIITWLT